MDKKFREEVLMEEENARGKGGVWELNEIRERS